jgi:hypothetical protein
LVTAPDVDLVITNKVVSDTNLVAGAYITASCYVSNLGSLSSIGSGHLAYYYSTDTILDPSDEYLAYDIFSSIESSLYSYEYANFYIPEDADTGYNYILFAADVNNSVSETNENNNIGYTRIHVEEPYIDLELDYNSLSVTTTALGESIRVLNSGHIASGSGNMYYFVSTDTIFDDNDTYLTDAYFSSINPGLSDYKRVYITINDETYLGDNYILFVADRYNNIDESDETNNVVYSPINLTLPIVDFVIEDVYVDYLNWTEGEYNEFGCRVRNIGWARHLFIG